MGGGGENRGRNTVHIYSSHGTILTVHETLSILRNEHN